MSLEPCSLTRGARSRLHLEPAPAPSPVEQAPALRDRGLLAQALRELLDHGRLGGTGKLAPLPPVEPRPYVSSDERFTPAQLAEGEAQYFAFCTICHNGPVNPDLLRSPVAASAEAWRAVVMDGALADNGMISFEPWLTARQAEAIRGYVLAEAARREAAAN